MSSLHELLATHATLMAFRAAIKAGADLDERDVDGNTPLIVAAADRLDGQAAVLIEAGADVTARGFRGRTALYFAANRGALVIFDLLLSAGASDTQPDVFGLTPLIGAIGSAKAHPGDTLTRRMARKAAHRLLDRGVPFDDPATAWLQTPLHFCALYGEAEVGERLLAMGADPERRDGNGYTARELAIERDQRPVARLIDDIGRLSLNTPDVGTVCLWLGEPDLGDATGLEGAVIDRVLEIDPVPVRDLLRRARHGELFADAAVHIALALDQPTADTLTTAYGVQIDDPPRESWRGQAVPFLGCLRYQTDGSDPSPALDLPR